MARFVPTPACPIFVGTTLLGVFLAACLPPTAGPRLPVEISEPSGMVRSPSHPGVFWVHSDSGNRPRLYAVDAEGRIVGRAEVQGVTNVDWEDIAARDGDLYIGDIGNNFQLRQDLVVLRVAEPSITDPSTIVPVPVLSRIHFRYPDQESFPATHPRFDAEALFWARDSLWLLSKHRDDHKTTLYRFPETTSEDVQTLERVRDLELGGFGHPYGGMTTGADVSADGQHLAILSYHAIFIFDLSTDLSEATKESSSDLLSHPVRRIELRAHQLLQCESITWDGQALIVTNEHGRIFRIEDAATGPDELFPGPKN